MSNEKRRQWIISLGFTEADADNFIKFELPDWKIEKMASRLQKPAEESQDVPAPGKLKVEARAKAPAEGEGFGNYLCPKCKVTHKAGSKIHKRHLKLLK